MQVLVELIFKVKSLVEAIPLPGMMVMVPLAMTGLAAIAASIARLIEDWLSRGH